jgi:transcription initiation factor TFIIH subunit 4
LQQFHIVTITKPSREEPQVISLTKNFAASLRLALTGGGKHNSFGVPSDDIVGSIDLVVLDNYARSQWEGILHYVVNSAGKGKQPDGQGLTSQVKDLLEAGHLVTKARHSSSGITQAGFSFLLQEVNAQVWTLLILWVENAEKVRSLLSRLFLSNVTAVPS